MRTRPTTGAVPGAGGAVRTIAPLSGSCDDRHRITERRHDPRVEERASAVERGRPLPDEQQHVARIAVTPNAERQPIARPQQSREHDVTAHDRLSANQDDLVALRHASALGWRARLDRLDCRILGEPEYLGAGPTRIRAHGGRERDAHIAARLGTAVTH